MFHGAIVATITPFRNGKLDASALKRLVEFQIRSGTDGIVPCGTTGESATLTYEEHERVIDLVLERRPGGCRSSRERGRTIRRKPSC